ncbi:unnamed protein product [Citrullus colocynthis]|uniref:Uncharacterized protein n=1 Tax=Citrullus colocynthis TaxID=252529 RepID=A0ABP0YI55_9ROSI
MWIRGDKLVFFNSFLDIFSRHTRVSLVGLVSLLSPFAFAAARRLPVLTLRRSPFAVRRSPFAVRRSPFADAPLFLSHSFSFPPTHTFIHSRYILLQHKLVSATGTSYAPSNQFWRNYSKIARRL